jgi:hypothetical protein
LSQEAENVHDGLDDGLNEAENNTDEPEDKLSQNITYEQPPININGARIISGVTNTMVQIRTPVGARLLREPISQGRDQEAYNSPNSLLFVRTSVAHHLDQQNSDLPNIDRNFTVGMKILIE